MTNKLDKHLKNAHIIGYEYALGLVEINIKHGLDPLDGVKEELDKLRKEASE